MFVLYDTSNISLSSFLIILTISSFLTLFNISYIDLFINIVDNSIDSLSAKSNKNNLLLLLKDFIKKKTFKNIMKIITIIIILLSINILFLNFILFILNYIKKGVINTS